MRRRRKPPSGSSPADNARSVFESFSVQVKEGPDDTCPWTVADRFLFWPPRGLWREINGTRMGYSALTLCWHLRSEARRPEIDAAGLGAVGDALAPPQDHQDERVPT